MALIPPIPKEVAEKYADLSVRKEYATKICWEWQNDIMHEFHAIVEEVDNKRNVQICDHFKIDLSELREFIDRKRKPQTNADRIRQMTNDELADFIGTADCLDCPLDGVERCSLYKKNYGYASPCQNAVREWLEQEVSDG